MELNCDICGDYGEVEPIYKQIKGRFDRLFVCPACKKLHELELEATRENFRRQFGVGAYGKRFMPRSWRDKIK